MQVKTRTMAASEVGKTIQLAVKVYKNVNPSAILGNSGAALDSFAMKEQPLVPYMRKGASYIKCYVHPKEMHGCTALVSLRQVVHLLVEGSNSMDTPAAIQEFQSRHGAHLLKQSRFCIAWNGDLLMPPEVAKGIPLAMRKMSRAKKEADIINIGVGRVLSQLLTLELVTSGRLRRVAGVNWVADGCTVTIRPLEMIKKEVESEEDQRLTLIEIPCAENIDNGDDKSGVGMDESSAGAAQNCEVAMENGVGAAQNIDVVTENAEVEGSVVVTDPVQDNAVVSAPMQGGDEYDTESDDEEQVIPATELDTIVISYKELLKKKKKQQQPLPPKKRSRATEDATQNKKQAIRAAAGQIRTCLSQIQSLSAGFSDSSLRAHATHIQMHVYKHVELLEEKLDGNA